MLRLFRRGGGVRLSALLAAGALGLARPAPAGSPLAGEVPAAEHAVRPSASAGRLEEIKVELAWLGDSTTFPYSLSARAREGSLQVRGRVPSEKVRQHALQVARAATSLPVQDALAVQPSLPPPPLPASGEELLPRVRWVLTEVLGSRAPTIEVGTRIGGHITLRGTVGSWDDKHTVSVRLREVTGCASVVNLLEVSSALTWPTAARLMPPAAQPGQPMPVPVPGPALPDVPPKKPAAKPPVTPPLMPPAVLLPASPPEKVETHIRVSANDEAGPVAPPKKPAPKPPLMPPAVLLPASPPGKVETHIRVSANDEAGPVIATADTIPAPAAPIATSAPRSVSPYNSAPAPLPGSLATSAEETAPKAQPRLISGFAQEKTEPLSCGTPTRDWPVPGRRTTSAPLPPPPAKPSMGARLVAWFKGKPKPKPMAPAEKRPPIEKKHNGWLAGSRPQLLSWGVQNKATSLRSGSPAPDKPYVTKGTIVFNEVQPTAFKPSAPPSAARLRQRVLSVCSGQARDVRVEPRPDQSLQVTITVANAAAEKDLVGRVLQLPEMTAPNVHVLVKVAP